MRRWPWALGLTLCGLVAIDALFLRMDADWYAIRDRLRGDVVLERALVADRVALLDVDRIEDERPLVFVLGSSRMDAGFEPERLQKRGRFPLHFVKLAHALMAPFEIRSAVPSLLARHPSLVVLGASEFDTHGALQLLPGSSFASGAALATVVARLGPTGVVERRQALYRMALASAWRLYHYRSVLGAAGISGLHTFESPAAPARPDVSDFWAGMRVDEIAESRFREVEERFRRRFPERGDTAHRAQLRLPRQIRRGEESNVQKALLRAAIAELRAAGVGVLIVELPLYPGLETLYDASTRIDFRAFASALSADPGVEFVPLDDQPPYVEDDFDDPIHLGPTGSAKLSRVVAVSAMRIARKQ